MSKNKLILNNLSIIFGALVLLVSGPLLADSITAGDAHNLVARGDGSQYVWGSDANGQLGDGLTLDALNPIPVVDIRYNSLDGAIAVVTHGDNNLVLLDDATLLGWGPNENSQLGSGLLYSGKYKGDGADNGGDGTDPGDGTKPKPGGPASAAIAFPTEVVDPDGKPISNITAMALGANFAAAVNQEGSVLVWGDLDAFREKEVSREPINRFRDKFFDPNIEFIDSRYRGGDPETNFDLQYMSDAQGNRYTNIISVAVGDNHLLALTNTGHVLAWGEIKAEQPGDEILKDHTYPVFVRNSQDAFIADIVSIAAHDNDSIAVKADGRLLGWGNSPLVAQPLSDGEGKPLTGISRVAMGESHTLGLTLDGRIKAWGNNSNGQLGDGTNFVVLGTATVILSDGQPIGNITEIAVGSSHSLALRRDGRVFAWGSGENGRLGDGTNIDSYYAVNVRDRNNYPFSLY
jgi:alpha-tubulin suppressor-like RCC1 family protein